MRWGGRLVEVGRVGFPEMELVSFAEVGCVGNVPSVPRFVPSEIVASAQNLIRRALRARPRNCG